MPQNQFVTKINGPWGSFLAIVLITGVVIAAKAILLPLALGLILAFLLTPAVACSIACGCRAFSACC